MRHILPWIGCVALLFLASVRAETGPEQGGPDLLQLKMEAERNALCGIEFIGLHVIPGLSDASEEVVASRAERVLRKYGFHVVRLIIPEGMFVDGQDFRKLPEGTIPANYPSLHICCELVPSPDEDIDTVRVELTLTERVRLVRQGRPHPPVSAATWSNSEYVFHRPGDPTDLHDAIDDLVARFASWARKADELGPTTRPSVVPGD